MTLSTRRHEPEALLARAAALRREQPGLRARDVATAMGISEGELVGAQVGRGVRRLAPRWPGLVQALPDLGKVMVLTRNEYVVHEKKGRFDKISVDGSHGLVLDPDIDLRIFFSRWGFGFAVEEETQRGVRRSLQFFDGDGTAVHKIYLTDGSDPDAFAALVQANLGEDQSAGQSVAPRPAAAAERPDAAIDVAELRKRWLALQDVHDFFALLRDLDVGREQAFRLVGDDLAQRVAPNAFRTAIERSAAAQVPVMIFVGSPGVIQIHTGPVRNLKTVGPWFNILDDGFNLHLLEEGVASTWLVRKPTSEGTVTSVEVFDAKGGQLAWMFGRRKPGLPELPAWRDLVEGLVGGVA